jgi:hypothetical protein
MIPGESLSALPRVGSFLYPDSRMLQMTRAPWDTSTRGRCLAADPKDWELGGIALNDPSQGLDYQTWQFFFDTDAIYTGPDPDGPWEFLLNTGPVTELSGAFDTDMLPAVAFVDTGDTKLWWFDPLADDYVITDFSAFTSPRLTLDTKLASQVDYADILFVYLDKGSCYYRQQRDRFAIEYLLCEAPIGTTRLGRVGMGTTNRLQIEFLS